MPMLQGPLAFYTALNDIVTEIASTMDADPDIALPGRVCVVNGAIAWDECECGQLVGTVVRWFYTDEFPTSLQATVSPAPCPPSLVVCEMAVSILRCAPQPGDNDLAPTCAALDASAQEVHRDAYTVRKTIACRLQEWKDDGTIDDYQVGDQTSAGPDGMCVGTDITFFISLNRLDQ